MYANDLFAYTPLKKFRNLRRAQICKILRNFPKLFFDTNEKAGRLPHIFAPKRGEMVINYKDKFSIVRIWAEVFCFEMENFVTETTPPVKAGFVPIGLRVHKVRTLVLLDKSPAFIAESVPKNALFWGFFAIFLSFQRLPCRTWRINSR